MAPQGAAARGVGRSVIYRLLPAPAPLAETVWTRFLGRGAGQTIEGIRTGPLGVTTPGKGGGVGGSSSAAARRWTTTIHPVRSAPVPPFTGSALTSSPSIYPRIRPSICGCGGGNSRRSTTLRRFSSSSPPGGGGDNESGSDGGGEDDTASWTTPLSEVSESDLNLAASAAAEAETESESDAPRPHSPGPGDHLSDIPGAEKGGKKLAIVFTCKVCSTRSAKKFTERAYTHGVVMVRCPGCENLHLIADRLGFFGDDQDEGGWDIQKALAKMGEDVRAVSDDNVLELTMADVLGRDKVGELEREAARAAAGGSSVEAGKEEEGNKGS